MARSLSLSLSLEYVSKCLGSAALQVDALFAFGLLVFFPSLCGAFGKGGSRDSCRRLEVPESRQAETNEPKDYAWDKRVSKNQGP